MGKKAYGYATEGTQMPDKWLGTSYNEAWDVRSNSLVFSDATTTVD